MNRLGFGFLCFGEDYYYKGTVDKVTTLLNLGFNCFILAENVEYFNTHPNLNLIPYSKQSKSYYDKLTLVDLIFKNHDVAILVDSDIHVVDYDWIQKLNTYNFKPGISYIKTLLEHPSKREFVKDLVSKELVEWGSYVEYLENLYPNYGELKTIWEYFLVFNKQGFNQEKFFEIYNTLQVAKEAGDLLVKKEVLGAGEGISIQVGGKLSNTPVEQDLILQQILSDKLISISRKFVRPEFWPEWMK